MRQFKSMQLFYIYMLFTIHRNSIYLIIIILFIINITYKKSIFECSTDFQKLNLPFCFNSNFKLSLYSALQRPNATKRSRTALCYVTTFGEIHLFYLYVYLYFLKPCVFFCEFVFVIIMRYMPLCMCLLCF